MDAHGKICDVAFKRFFPSVFVSAVGQSFYKQNVPSKSMHLGVSFTAMHWLSRDPWAMRGHPTKAHFCQLNAEEREARGRTMRAQAAADYATVMNHRARELRKGGRMVLVNFTETEEGFFLGKGPVGVSMYDTFCKVWCGMVCDQLHPITSAEASNLSFPNYYRSFEEAVGPFNEKTGSLSHIGLKVVHAEVKRTPCPYREALTADGDEGLCGMEFADRYYATTKTWSNATFVAALDEGRSEDEKAAIVERFWLKCRKEIAASPKGTHGMDYFHTYITFEKTN